VTELVSNCLKHAFPDQRAGEIVVSLKSDNQGVRTLAISDNGVGLPPDFDARNTESLGLQLVSTLANQLEATLDIHREAGTSFVLRFRELPAR
jgi:two-component sensor histidine kinase